ncbi:MAG: hypothetical protein K2M07_08820 [Muribaculaceae bacterium]|nr:hypothetical protein [Muribaculaceae bacterium]
MAEAGDFLSSALILSRDGAEGSGLRLAYQATVQGDGGSRSLPLLCLDIAQGWSGGLRPPQYCSW